MDIRDKNIDVDKDIDIETGIDIDADEAKGIDIESGIDIEINCTYTYAYINAHTCMHTLTYIH